VRAQEVNNGRLRDNVDDVALAVHHGHAVHAAVRNNFKCVTQRRALLHGQEFVAARQIY
jgi:hypothetical protein